LDGIAHLPQFLALHWKSSFKILQFVPRWQEALGNAELE
jgi:hypothetical protein